MNKQRGSWILAVILFTCGLSGCRSIGGTQSRILTGQVVDPQNTPVAGVEVRVPGRPAVLTDGRGRFRIRHVAATERLAVSFRAPRYMETTSIYDQQSRGSGNTIVIWPRATAVVLDAVKGGRAAFPAGNITFPPNAFVDASGGAVTGPVNVSMSVLDLADPRQVASAPGDFTARMRDGSVRNLETFGLFELVIADANGRRVELARDRDARVELTMPRVPGRDFPAAVGSFSFEQPTGRWVEEAEFAVESLEASSWLLQSQITSTGWWNADQPYDTTCLTVRVLGCRGCEGDSTPILGAEVTATGADYTGAVSVGQTNASGEVCLPVKKGANVKLDVKNGSIFGNPLYVATDPNAIDPANCTSCPLVTATHVVAAPFADALAAHDSFRWCASNFWNGSPSEFGNAWLFNPTGQPKHVTFSASTGLTLTLDNLDEAGAQCIAGGTNCKGAAYASGEYKTNCFHGYGTYTATITPPAPLPNNGNSGIVTGFFTYTRTDANDPGDGTIAENNAASSWDEVDLELLGREPIATDCDLTGDCAAPNNCSAGDLVVHTNYIGKGVGNHEIDYCLPHATRTYSFTWTKDDITWRYVDGANQTQVLRVEQRNGTPNWPTQPGRVFMNLWANDTGQTWVGNFTYPGVPVTAVFKDVSVP
jgi:beta-glucanase (GH16 family)